MITDASNEFKQKAREFTTTLRSLSELAEDARLLPFSTQATIDKQQLTNLIEKLYQVTPSAIQKAEALLQYENTIRTNSENNAQTILSKAKRSEEERLKSAAAKAATIEKTANQNAENTISDADNKAKQILEEAEKRAEQIISEAQARSETLINQDINVLLAQQKADVMIQNAQLSIDTAYQALIDHFKELFGVVESSLEQRLSELRQTRSDLLRQLDVVSSENAQDSTDFASCTKENSQQSSL